MPESVGTAATGCADQPCIEVLVVPSAGPAPAPYFVTRQDISGNADVDNTHVGSNCTMSCGDYLTRLPGGSVTDDPGRIAAGLSIRGIATLAGVAPDSLTSATIQGSLANNRAQLSSATGDFDLPGTPGFPFDDKLVPVFVGDANSVEYVRPLRTPSGPGDLDYNYDDVFQGTTTFVVTLYETGRALDPAITARTATTITAGGSVDFTAATGDGAVADQGRIWTWSYGDGYLSGEQGPSAHHVYSTPGRYLVRVQVLDDDGSSGVSTQPVAVTVEPSGKSSSSPRPSTSSTPSTSTSPTGSRSPSTSRGNGTGLAPTQGPVSATGHQGGGAPVAPSGGAVAGEASGTAGPASTGSGPSPSSARRSSSPSDVGAGPVVVGYLLPGQLPGGGVPSAAVSRRPDAAPAARSGSPFSGALPPWVFAVFGILALLVLGAGAELRRPSRGPKRRA